MNHASSRENKAYNVSAENSIDTTPITYNKDPIFTIMTMKLYSDMTCIDTSRQYSN